MADRSEIMEAMVKCEPYIASEIAEELEIPRRTADYHLRKLAEGGQIHRKKHSERRVTYWVE